MIKVENLSKTFTTNKALLNINLEIKERLIIGLVGNNGAGKTTLINALMGYIPPSKGTVKIFGQNPIDSPIVAANTMLVDEKITYDPFIKLEKIIEKFQTFVEDFDKFKCYNALEKFGLKTDRFYSRLSKGMKNQFNIAIGFGCGKDFTIFDEPVAGLDELARDKFYDLLIEDYDKEHKLYIVSTHLLAEMQNITSKLIVMRSGMIIVYNDTDKIASYFATLTGNCDKIAPLLVGRRIYSQEQIMNIGTFTIDNNLSRDEKKYVKEQGIELANAKANQACKIICNMDWFPPKEEVQDDKN